VAEAPVYLVRSNSARDGTPPRPADAAPGAAETPIAEALDAGRRRVERARDTPPAREAEIAGADAELPRRPAVSDPGAQPRPAAL
jgi:hypothetical protein